MEMIRWDIYAAVAAPKAFPTSCPVRLSPLAKYELTCPECGGHLHRCGCGK